MQRKINKDINEIFYKVSKYSYSERICEGYWNLWIKIWISYFMQLKCQKKDEAMEEYYFSS